MVNSNDKKISKSARRRRTVRIVYAIISLLLVVGMIIAGIVYGN